MSIDNVADVSRRVQYVAANGQTEFPYTFPIFDEDDLVVQVDGATQTITTDYTVDGVEEDAGGDVTFIVAMSGGEIITIYSETAIQRLSDFQQNGPNLSAVMNDELDRITIVQQELREGVRRSIRFPMSSAMSASDTELSPISNWEDRYLYINSDGELEPAENLTTTTLTQSVIAALLIPQTDAEAAALVTPTNYAYPELDIRRYGAVGDGTSAGTGTDDTAAIQAAINVAQQFEADHGGSSVYVPASRPGNVWRTTAALTMNGLGVSMHGDGAGSVIFNTTANSITLDIGDNAVESDDNKVIGINFGGSGATSIGIRARLCPNLHIERCNIQGTNDGIRATGIYCARLIGNTMGGITGYGMHLTASSNSMIVTGNRVDGASIAATAGLLIAGAGNYVVGNTFETIDTGVILTGERGSVFSNYMETYEYGYKVTDAGSEGNTIGGFFAATDATCSIQVSAGVGLTINNIHCNGTHSSGAPIECTTGPSGVFIGPNIAHDDAYTVTWPINHLALNQHLLTDNLYPAEPGYLAVVTHTGTVAETTLKTYTAVRQHLGTGTQIYVRAAGRCINTNDAKTVRLKLAGTTIATIAELAAATDDWVIEAHIDIQSAIVAVGTVIGFQGAAVEVFDVLNSGVTIDLASTNPAVTLTAELANTADSITLNHWKVQVVN